MSLTSLLKSTFGFPSFRANQEAVCRAATDGRDVLLVMPTGAGKSLCYQIPAIARGGTGLVVSPLIALMDDQAAKLSAAGLKVARIHSGLSREDARQACRDYLDGQLNFLFIAPERMRVPGFPEMLAKRKPALIAIDEAHCISAWGHDFRPDYRTLGEHLPALRPSPIVALTATATPQVQKDIAAQLHLHNPALFIHGFRRDNLHIEVVEMSKPRRPEFVKRLLSQRGSRPAIVYAPSRKAAEELAATLGKKAAAYHAGLDSSIREHVQQSFQSGKLEVVVATIAFGMGIDKADVRTVIHAAMPASVEAYYQEIGRAGRDGLSSRTVLLHSYADRKMHEFFLERDYPPVTDLARVATLLTEDFQMPAVLGQRLKMDADTLAKAIDKLTSQGAAQLDMAGNVRRGASPSAAWKSSYDAQLAHRRAQIDSMQRFADTQQCRMTALIRHFGDLADASKPCGHCDFCSPESATAQTFTAPGQEQTRQLQAILRALDGGVSRATGRLFTETGLKIDRKEFDGLLDALARAGLVTITADTFTNAEGNVLPYKKATLTHEGKTLDFSEPLPVVLREQAEAAPSRSRSKTKPATRTRVAGTKPPAFQAATRQPQLRPPQLPTARPASVSPENPSRFTRERRAAPDPAASLTPDQQRLDQRLRDWRKAESERIGLPQFFILGSSTLRSIVLAKPRDLHQLQSISGIGPEKAAQFGANILELCNV